jgi:hypothetical protein
MTHLSSDELIDAMEGRPAPDRQAHLTTCEQCQRTLAELSSMLAAAKLVSVPEPSPFFWQQFSERVRIAIDDEAVAGSNWPSWLRWPVLLPLGAVALIILALMFTVPKQSPSDALDAAVALDTPEAPENWTMLADLVGGIDLDTAVAAGVAVTPGLAERAVLELTADEQQELTRLLKAELTRAKS